MSKSRNFLATVQLIQTGAVADTEFAITHELQNINGVNIVPAGAFVLRRFDPSSNLYLGTTPWTDTTAYLKCTSGSKYFLVMFFH